MRDVTVKDPPPRFSRWPDHVPPLSRSHIDDVGLEARHGIEWNPIARYDGERPPMHMHWVNEIVVGANDPKLDCFTDFHPKRIGSRPCLPIYREEIWQPAPHQHRRIRLAIAIQPFLKLHDILVIRLRFAG